MLRTAALCSSVATAAAAAGKPNFILLMSDDMGWGDVGYNNVSSRIALPGAGGEMCVRRAKPLSGLACLRACVSLASVPHIGRGGE